MKPASRKNGDMQTDKPAKLSLRVSTEAYRRLFVTSVMSGETASAIVEGLILDGLKRFSMPADLSRRQTTQSAPPALPDESMPEISAEAA